MARHSTHKTTAAGKSRTIARRQSRAVKMGAARTTHAGRAR